MAVVVETVSGGSDRAAAYDVELANARKTDTAAFSESVDYFLSRRDRKPRGRKLTRKECRVETHGSL